MTCREKLEMEHPEFVDYCYVGGCSHCPSTYGYLDDPDYCSFRNSELTMCKECWDREISSENEGKTNNFDDTENKGETYNADDNLDVLKYAINVAIAANNKSISISIVNGSIMLNIYPNVNDENIKERLPETAIYNLDRKEEESHD